VTDDFSKRHDRRPRGIVSPTGGCYPDHGPV
jgi:hypothetical protein